MEKTVTNWQSMPEDIFEYFGFVYLIINTVTDQKYLGKKIFKNTNRKKVKGRKNRKISVKESNWKKYISSSKEVHIDIEKYGKDKFAFQIIKLCKSRADWSYTEVKEQFNRDVLTARLPNGEFEYYNLNISGKFHRIKEIL